MKLLRYIAYLFISGGLLFSIASCDDSSSSPDTQEPEGGDTQYVIAANSGDNDYLLQTASADTGSISAQNENAIQVLGNRQWFFYEDLVAYGFLYNQGQEGTVSSYVLDDEGSLLQRQELGLEVSIQSRGTYGDNLVIQYSSRSYENPVATFYMINAMTEELSNEITVDTDEIAPENEMGYFTDIAEYDGYILASFRTISGGADEELGTWGSNSKDETFIAVYNENFELQTVLRDQGRTGQVAGNTRSQGRTGIEVVESGDVYVFASAMDAPEDVPSGILKINEGELEFDPDYFFNISELSGNRDIYRTYYMGGSTFIVRMYDGQASASPATTKTGFAVVDVVNQTFEWINGVPAEMTEISYPYIDKDNNRLLYGITTPDTRPHIYSIDPETATMTRGKEVVAEGITAVGKLSIQ